MYKDPGAMLDCVIIHDWSQQLQNVFFSYFFTDQTTKDKVQAEEISP